ncbi:MAG: glycosyltransferase family 4 protein [Acidimicrobiales bacterium]
MGLPRIRYVSHGFPSGYGEAARRLVRALTGMGIALEWVPIRFDPERPLLSRGCASQFPDLEPLRGSGAKPDVVVVHTVPEMLPYMARVQPTGVPLVSHTVWEAPELQTHWPGILNSCDAVIVPTAWNARAFRSAGVMSPTVVVPHVASTEEDDPGSGEWLGPALLGSGSSFVVHSIASWTARKAPWLTVEAYARAFGPEDDTLLVLRTDALVHHELPVPEGPESRRCLTSWSVAQILHRHAPTGRVHLVHEVRSNAELGALHRRSDCWFALPRAEGWCLGAFDAAVAGTPVVTTACGGQLSYLDASESELVPGTPGTAPGLDGVTWVQPDLGSAVEALRRVKQDPRAARERAAPQRERLRRTYAPEVVGRRLLEALEEAGVL